MINDLIHVKNVENKKNQQWGEADGFLKIVEISKEKKRKNRLVKLKTKQRVLSIISQLVNYLIFWTNVFA